MPMCATVTFEDCDMSWSRNATLIRSNGTRDESPDNTPIWDPGEATIRPKILILQAGSGAMALTRKIMKNAWAFVAYCRRTPIKARPKWCSSPLNETKH